MDEIINYTTQTPENTNANVLRSMLEGLYDKPKEEAIAAINAAGSTQVQAVANKGMEVLQSIGLARR